MTEKRYAVCQECCNTFLIPDQDTEESWAERHSHWCMGPLPPEPVGVRRERIAVAIMAGFASTIFMMWDRAKQQAPTIARVAVEWADALIAELDKPFAEAENPSSEEKADESRGLGRPRVGAGGAGSDGGLPPVQ